MDNDKISALSSSILFDTLVTVFSLTVSLCAERAKAVVLVTLLFCFLLAWILFSCLMAVRRPSMFRLWNLTKACMYSCSAFERRHLMSFLNSPSAFMLALALHCSDFGQVCFSRCFIPKRLWFFRRFYWQSVFPRWPPFQFPDQSVKGIMRTYGEVDFRFRLKLKITLVKLTYPSQCPSLSPHFL